MNQQIELFMSFTLIVYSLFLLLPYLEKIIDFVGKTIITIVKFFVKTIIQTYTLVLFFLWTCIIFSTFFDMTNHFINNNYQIYSQNIKNITENNFEKIILRDRL